MGRAALQVFLAALFLAAWAWLLNPLAGVLITATVLFHESGHAAACKLFGMKVGGIYFVPLLGAAVHMGDGVEDMTAMEVSYIALAGPATGLAIGIVGGAAFLATGSDVVAGVTATALYFNLFNLIPAVPLDGGRVAAAVADCASATGVKAVCFASAVVGGLSLLWVTGLTALVGVALLFSVGTWFDPDKPRRLSTHEALRVTGTYLVLSGALGLSADVLMTPEALTAVKQLAGLDGAAG